MMLLIALLGALLLVAGFEMLLVLGIPALAIKAGAFAAIPNQALVQKLVGGINHSTLLAIPFFVLAANLMGAGRIAPLLIDVVRSLVGHARGGMGHTAVGASMAFGAVSGSAPATVAAMGRTVYPQLRREGFSDRFSLGLLVSSAETALLIPPSITFIVYGWITGTSIAKLFAGGLAVGAFLGLCFALMVAIEARRTGLAVAPRASWGERAAAIRAARWALGMPLIILGGIYSGFFTPTEAAAVSVVYAIVVETLLHRELGLRDVLRIAEQSAVASAVIFVLLAMGALLSWFVTLAQVPTQVLAWLDAIQAGPVMFLLIVNACFLLAGMFLDPNSALLILVPPLFPVATALGVDPVHFGMIVTLNIGLGMITPPFGLDLFVASSTLDKPVMDVVRGVLPFIAVNLIALLVVTYVPALSLFVPRLIYG